MISEKSMNSLASGPPPHVVVHRDVLDLSAALVDANPDIEVGGKLVGFDLTVNSDMSDSPYWHALAKRKKHLLTSNRTLCILGSIPSGPAATQTATSLIPDAKFQYGTYRFLENTEPQIDHLGSWHSHHPNGLRSFSQGDHEHYMRVVQRDDYNSNYFVAGLCFDRSGLARGIFDLYTRDNPGRPIHLDESNLIVTDQIPSLQSLVSSAASKLAPNHLGVPALHPRLEEISFIEQVIGKHSSEAVSRVDDADAVSWIFIPESDPSMRIVVTLPSADRVPPAISIESNYSGARIVADFSTLDDLKAASRSIVKAAEKLVKDLKKVMG